MFLRTYLFIQTPLARDIPHVPLSVWGHHRRQQYCVAAAQEMTLRVGGRA